MGLDSICSPYCKLANPLRYTAFLVFLHVDGLKTKMIKFISTASYIGAHNSQNIHMKQRSSYSPSASEIVFIDFSFVLVHTKGIKVIWGTRIFMQDIFNTFLWQIKVSKMANFHSKGRKMNCSYKRKLFKPELVLVLFIKPFDAYQRRRGLSYVTGSPHVWAASNFTILIESQQNGYWNFSSRSQGLLNVQLYSPYKVVTAKNQFVQQLHGIKITGTSKCS